MSEPGSLPGMEHLYRFRSTSALLGEYSELERQTIHFASPATLNDPLEGLKNLFWQGDGIVWENLFRHYVASIMSSLSLLAIGHDQLKLVRDATLTAMRTADNPKQKERTRAFLAPTPIHSLIQSLANRRLPVHRNEMLWYLQCVHFHAVRIALEDIKGEKWLTVDPTSLFFHLAESTLVSLADIRHSMNSLDDKTTEPTDEIERFFTIVSAMKAQDCVRAKLAFRGQTDEKVTSLLFEFPKSYLEAISEMVHFPAYAACFVEDYRNSAMWGHYADRHKGCCLIFKAQGLGEDLSLRLRVASGLISNAGSEPVPHFSTQSFRFHTVIYTNEMPHIDFFRSLGRLTLSEMAFWHHDDRGNASVCRESYVNDETGWRQKYWDGFASSAAVKLFAWSYERERRLILSDFTVGGRPELQTLSYDFDDLDGIIFGINTSDDDKVKIVERIRVNCKDHARDKFPFYQACYSQSTGDIDAVELPSLTAP